MLTDKEAAFKIMCKAESEALEEKRNRFGVFCNYSIIDFYKLKKHHAYRFKKQLIDLSAKNNELLGDAFALVKLIHMSADSVSGVSINNIKDEIVIKGNGDKKKK